jgi:RNA polymerase-binding protein DksA
MNEPLVSRTAAPADRRADDVQASADAAADPATTSGAPGPADARGALLAARAQAVEELDDTQIEGPGQMTYGSQAAAASHVFEQQRDLALREHLEQHIRAIDAALARLDDGTYGRCESCGQPIAAERLEALPWAALCIDCQRTTARRR